ncbi:glutaredoxin family protein [Chloroflexus sp.]|uniref:glutaredoxin family protein n=1 Tax=Chloroflexus sp. TaxID=1904827 RepID=UPI002ADD86B4|nr:glutaredoxin domain-containing protein [Chloroflexus sp.]
MTQPLVTIYGAMWCGDCRRTKRFLDQHGVQYTWIDIEQHPAAASTMAQLNGGRQSIPTLVFTDGSVLVEPDNRELAQKLGLG